ncbi:hypothetical protein ACSQ6I_17870 [Anabaena sp. WFMT]|uniref:hypothetical protein n=1 Tax=Anabaena sp. WFMT TaxID=3449730 RepID=UPI003F1F119A
MVSQILTAIASISTILPEPWGDRLHYLYLNDRFAPLANLFLGSEIQPVGCLWACSHGSYPAHHSKSHGVASQLLHICVATINYKLPFWDINLPFLDRIDMSNNSMLYIFWSTTIAMTN